MQHTKLDRWLCRKFVHINQIYFNTMPDNLPQGLDVKEAEEESGARYRYRATTRSEGLAREACDTFAAQSITYTARVDQLDTPLARFLGNPKRSVTMLMVWIGLILLGVLFILSGVTQMAISAMLQDKEAVKAPDKVKKVQRIGKKK